MKERAGEKHELCKWRKWPNAMRPNRLALVSRHLAFHAYNMEWMKKKNPRRSKQSRRGWADKNRYLVLLRKMTRYALIPHHVVNIPRLHSWMENCLHQYMMHAWVVHVLSRSNDALKLYERCSAPSTNSKSLYKSLLQYICHQHNIAFGKGLVSCTWPFCAQGQSQLCL